MRVPAVARSHEHESSDWDDGSDLNVDEHAEMHRWLDEIAADVDALALKTLEDETQNHIEQTTRNEGPPDE